MDIRVYFCPFSRITTRDRRPAVVDRPGTIFRNREGSPDVPKGSSATEAKERLEDSVGQDTGFLSEGRAQTVSWRGRRWIRSGVGTL